MSQWDCEFKTEPHPARRMEFGKLVPVSKTMQQLMVKEGETWVRVAWCGMEPGRPVTFCVTASDEFAKAARDWVELNIGRPGSVGGNVDLRATLLDGEEDDDE